MLKNMSKPNKTALNKQLGYNVYALHHAFGRFYQTAFADTGFTYPKYIVMMALEEAGPLSLSELSAKVGLEANSLSPLVKKMSTAGVVERIRDPEDERRVLLTLLPFGKKVLKEGNAVVQAGWDQLGLSESDVETTSGVLKDVRETLEKTTPKRVMPLPDRDDAD